MAKKPAAPKADNRTTARPKLDQLGVDWVCDQIADGRSLTWIAKEAGVSIGSLLTWLSTEPERSARVDAARRAASWVYEEQALQGLLDATDPFSLTKARDVAHHLRWKASKIHPQRFGDKVQAEVNTTLSGSLQVKADLTLSPAEAYERLLRAGG